ncbi:hypothetical protein N665_0030s0133 [Sinapis alba]|nr:hypothetical protein N665_0030s0133 [Sinapis alba]
MPVGFEVLSGFLLSGLFTSEVWSKFSSTTIISFSHSKKRSIGGFLFVLISLWALSLTALSSPISETGLKSANSSFL